MKIAQWFIVHKQEPFQMLGAAKFVMGCMSPETVNLNGAIATPLSGCRRRPPNPPIDLRSPLSSRPNTLGNVTHQGRSWSHCGQSVDI